MRRVLLHDDTIPIDPWCVPIDELGRAVELRTQPPLAGGLDDGLLAWDVEGDDGRDQQRGEDVGAPREGREDDRRRKDGPRDGHVDRARAREGGGRGADMQDALETEGDAHPDRLARKHEGEDEAAAISSQHCERKAQGEVPRTRIGSAPNGLLHGHRMGGQPHAWPW